MRVTSASLALTSTHAVHRSVTQRLTAEAWKGERPAAPAAPPAASAPGGDGQGAAAAPTLASTRDEIALAILVRHFHIKSPLRRLELARAGEDPAPAPPAARAGAQGRPAAGWGLRAEVVTEAAETETSTFSAAGRVTTADGRTIEVDLALRRSSTRVERSSLELRAGDAALVDPLVLDLDGAPARFEGTHAFDLDADGAPEQVARLAPGAAYLARDLDGSRAVESGAELFGPTTGDGRAELAALDADRSGWVDEADPAFGSLRLWNPTTGELTTLAAAGVGALSTAAAATPFELRGASGAVRAQVAATGVYLREDGGAGALEHVDLVV